MGNNDGHAVNLKQYRRLDGKWQFVPVVKQNGKPTPELVLINGKPVRPGGGISYLGFGARTASAALGPSAVCHAIPSTPGNNFLDADPVKA